MFVLIRVKNVFFEKAKHYDILIFEQNLNLDSKC